MPYPFRILRSPVIDRGGHAMVIVTDVVVVDEGTMDKADAAGWRKALNVLAFRSHTRSNGLAVGSHEFRLQFIGRKPRGHCEKTLTRSAW